MYSHRIMPNGQVMAADNARPTSVVHSRVLSYLLAVGIFLIALAARFALLSQDSGLGFLTFYPAVALSALLFGTGPGLAVVVLSMATVNIVLMSPHWEIKLHYAQAMPMAVFGISGIIVCFIAHRMWSYINDARENKKHHQAIFDASPDAVLIIDPKGRITMANRQTETLLGFTKAELLGHSYDMLIPAQFRKNHPALRSKYLEAPTARPMGRGNVVKALHKDGRELDVEISLSPIYTKDGVLMASALRDITDRKLAEEKIRELAFFDQLTGLPNRALFMDRLKQAMVDGERRDYFGALLFLDLDHFKSLNDTRGHDVGDELLKQVAARLKLFVREGDTVARLGGDEFVVILSNLNSRETDAAIVAETVAAKILHALNQPYLLNDHVHRSTASIGVTLFKGDMVSIDTLIKQADLTMYKAKSAGRNGVRFFDAAMESAVVERVAMEAELHHAIKEQQFVLHYQAQVAGPNQLTGAEALIRWNHPQRGLIYPDQFIPLTEETRLILPLGHWVLETACAQLALWAEMPHMADLTLAVNVCALQFRQDNFVASLLNVLESTGANPQRLKLELTESVMVDDVAKVIKKMHELRNIGVGFSLDDFGTGYSSLSYLKKFPLDQLKIDRSFVQDVLTDPNDASIARTIVALSQSLGFSVIAEGVETEEQREFLADNGCHAYQGYLFSRPIPLLDFETLAAELPA